MDKIFSIVKRRVKHGEYINIQAFSIDLGQCAWPFFVSEKINVYTAIKMVKI